MGGNGSGGTIGSNTGGGGGIGESNASSNTGAYLSFNYANVASLDSITRAGSTVGLESIFDSYMLFTAGGQSSNAGGSGCGGNGVATGTAGAGGIFAGGGGSNGGTAVAGAGGIAAGGGGAVSATATTAGAGGPGLVIVQRIS